MTPRSRSESGRKRPRAAESGPIAHRPVKVLYSALPGESIMLLRSGDAVIVHPDRPAKIIRAGAKAPETLEAW